MARLFKTEEERKGFWKKVADLALTDVRVVAGGMDTDALETLEERLLAADFGVRTTIRLVDRVEEVARRGGLHGQADLRMAIRGEVARILEPSVSAELSMAPEGPTVYLVVGVNGVGKTTSIAKLGRAFQTRGKSVLLAAADTYRAGAVEQLEVWARRIGAGFVGGQAGGDPAAVAFDAIDAARSRNVDLVLVDTAGRLHTRRNLMGELSKLDRVIRRKVEGAPHETLIVLDATTGQNALSQVRSFREAVELTGIILAKLDSSARGGIIVALQEEFGLPVKAVGVGETVGDLERFDPEAFLEGVFAS